MKRTLIFLSGFSIFVYALSYFLEVSVIKTLIGLLSFQLFVSLASIGENEGELAELKEKGNSFREWHAWVLIACLTAVLFLLLNYFPELENYGAKNN